MNDSDYKRISAILHAAMKNGYMGGMSHAQISKPLAEQWLKDKRYLEHEFIKSFFKCRLLSVDTRRRLLNVIKEDKQIIDYLCIHI